MSNLFKEFMLAGAILTRLPLFTFINLIEVEPSRAVKFFALIGFIIGLILSVFLYLFYALNIPTLLSATMLILISIIITGGLHEDGLADCCDSFGAMGDNDKKLKIMRDSRIGAYGVISLIFSLLFRILLIYYIIEIDIYLALAAIIIINILARANLGILMYLLKPIRNDGLAFEASKVKFNDVIIVFAIIFISSIILIEPSLILGVIITNILIIIIYKSWVIYYVGGYSGDVLGAGEQFFEVILYFAILVFQINQQSIIL